MNKLTKLLLASFIMLFFNCGQKRLDNSKIDFEVRKIVITDGGDIENPTIERKSEKEKQLYLFYEDEIKMYQKDLSRTFDLLDSLRDYKEFYLEKIAKRHAEILKNGTDYDKENLEIFSPTAEDEYEDILGYNESSQRYTFKNLDSVNKLYESVSKTALCYELDYVISGKSPSSEKNLIQNIRIWVDEDSNIFRRLWLDLPTEVE
ncbi:hypothetical protein DHD05_18860 [Arenibacter sp. N53]|uniref:hypothetical protein n=1 Tax=Arenibacter TaxID=178469 RepID=UPI000CD46D45|nr:MULTISPECIES: hypothetical protein [Arenibacter]MCM4153658.1 hypothetical protein [Arenibacter sp. N53]